MSSKSESAIRTAIKEHIIKRNGFALVVSGSTKQSSGIPDIDASIWSPHWSQNSGYLHWKLEVKTDTGKPSRKQIEILRMYRQQGYCVGIVTSITDFQLLMSAYEAWDLAKTMNAIVTEEEIFAHYGIEDTYDIYPPYEE